MNYRVACTRLKSLSKYCTVQSKQASIYLLSSGKTCKEPSLAATKKFTWSCPVVKISGVTCKPNCLKDHKLSSSASVTTCFSRNSSWYPNPESFDCVPGNEGNSIAGILIALTTLIAFFVAIGLFLKRWKSNQQKGKTAHTFCCQLEMTRIPH